MSANLASVELLLAGSLRIEHMAVKARAYAIRKLAEDYGTMNMTVQSRLHELAHKAVDDPHDRSRRGDRLFTREDEVKRIEPIVSWGKLFCLLHSPKEFPPIVNSTRQAPRHMPGERYQSEHILSSSAGMLLRWRVGWRAQGKGAASSSGKCEALSWMMINYELCTYTDEEMLSLCSDVDTCIDILNNLSASISHKRQRLSLKLAAHNERGAQFRGLLERIGIDGHT